MVQNPTILPLINGITSIHPAGFKPRWKVADFSPYKFGPTVVGLTTWVTELRGFQFYIQADHEPLPGEFWAMLETTAYLGRTGARIPIHPSYDPDLAYRVLRRHAGVARELGARAVFVDEPAPTMSVDIANEWADL